MRRTRQRIQRQVDFPQSIEFLTYLSSLPPGTCIEVMVTSSGGVKVRPFEREGSLEVCFVPAYNPMLHQMWPEQMRADTAAAFCDERSVAAFRRAVGTLYPLPYKVPGKGERWTKKDLEMALIRLRSGETYVEDAAEIL